MRRLLYIWLLLIGGCCLASATLPTIGADQVVAGRVVMTDGEVYEFPTIFLPEYTDPGLMASSTVGYHDSLMIFDANDILYIEIWHSDTPQRIHRLYSVRLKKQPRHIAHYWAQLDIRTPYGLVVMAYPRYRMEPDGSLRCITLYGNRTFCYPRIFALHYGKEYYDTWPLDLDSRILDYLNRDGDHGPGSFAPDASLIFDTGFDADDFFQITDAEMGL